MAVEASIATSAKSQLQVIFPHGLFVMMFVNKRELFSRTHVRRIESAVVFAKKKTQAPN